MNNGTVSWTKKCIVDQLSLNHLLTPKELEATCLLLSADVFDDLFIEGCAQMSPYCMPHIILADLESIVRRSLFSHSDDTTSSQDGWFKKSDNSCNLCNQSVENFTDSLSQVGQRSIP